MPVSKIRTNAPMKTEDLDVPHVGDMTAYVIFTQKREQDIHLLAGYLEAADVPMAMLFAKEHYGQDQECVNIWAFPMAAIAGTHADHPTSSEPGEKRRFQIFTQKASGDIHRAAGEVEAEHSEGALVAAKAQLPGGDDLHSIWVVDWNDISSTEPGEMIWRNTDQTYRLARGYAKDVRQKWEAVRAVKDVDDYQAEDLKEEF